MKTFNIDIQFVESVVIREEQYLKQYANETSEDFVIRKLKYCPSRIVSTYMVDHPEFTKLRDQLEDEGYIKTERNWWNGDRVLKPFTLNGVLFDKDCTFYSSAAMKWTLDHGNITI